MFNRNDHNDLQNQMEGPPKLVPQRTFKVKYEDLNEDGESRPMETLVTCRVIKLMEGILYFADAVPSDTPEIPYVEVIVLAVPLSGLVRYAEIVMPPASKLVVN